MISPRNLSTMLLQLYRRLGSIEVESTSYCKHQGLTSFRKCYPQAGFSLSSRRHRITVLLTSRTKFVPPDYHKQNADPERARGEQLGSPEAFQLFEVIRGYEGQTGDVCELVDMLTWRSLMWKILRPNKRHYRCTEV